MRRAELQVVKPLASSQTQRRCGEHADLSRTKRWLTPIAPSSPIHLLLAPLERESRLLCILSPRIGPTTLCIFCHHRQLLNRGRACVGTSMETAPNFCRDLLDRLQNHVCTHSKPILPNSESLESIVQPSRAPVSTMVMEQAFRVNRRTMIGGLCLERKPFYTIALKCLIVSTKQVWGLQTLKALSSRPRLRAISRYLRASVHAGLKSGWMPTSCVAEAI